jgi:hypothetical protein
MEQRFKSLFIQLNSRFKAFSLYAIGSNTPIMLVAKGGALFGRMPALHRARRRGREIAPNQMTQFGLHPLVP